jgi:two-component system sensor histidine kinase/response regulator
MPELDGFEVVQAIRERERTTGTHLPVIAVTARSRQEDRERCLAAGMDDFLTKPIGPAELFAAIDRVFAGRPASGGHLALSTEPGVLLAPKTLLAACDNDPVLLDTLIRVFKDNISGSLAQVQEAITRADPERLQESGHELRGLVSTFSTKAAQAAALLEALGASGQIGDAASILDGLTGMAERLVPQLEELSIEHLRHEAAGGRPQ